VSFLSVLRIALLALVLSSWIVTSLVAAMTGLRVDYGGIASFLGAGMLSCTMLVVFAAYRRRTRLIAVCETIGGCLALTLPMLLSTYLAMRAGQPLMDAPLQAVDKILFDWHAFIAFVDSRPALAWVLGQSYQSFAIQVLVLPIVLSMLGKTARAYRMVIAFGLIGFVSSAIAIWFPALGTYPTYIGNEAAPENINTYYGYFFLQQFDAVRSDPAFVFTPRDLAGIVTFPSVHAAVAILCMWATWDLALIRLPMLVLNMLMATSAISHANHYLIDVIGGIAVATICIIFVTRLAREKTEARANPILPNPMLRGGDRTHHLLPNFRFFPRFMGLVSEKHSPISRF